MGMGLMGKSHFLPQSSSRANPFLISLVHPTHRALIALLGQVGALLAAPVKILVLISLRRCLAPLGRC